MFGGSGAKPSMWRVWLGIHISHGLGIFTFGLLCLLIATHDFTLVERIDAIRPLAIAFSGRLPRPLASLLVLRTSDHHRHRHSMLHRRHRALA